MSELKIKSSKMLLINKISILLCLALFLFDGTDLAPTTKKTKTKKTTTKSTIKATTATTTEPTTSTTKPTTTPTTTTSTTTTTVSITPKIDPIYDNAFCQTQWRNYSLKLNLSVSLTTSSLSLIDTLVLDTGRFIVLRYPLMELYDSSAALLMSKKLQITPKPLSVVIQSAITADDAGFLYIYVYGYSLSLLSLSFDYFSVLAKLDLNGNIIASVSLNLVPFTRVTYNADDKSIYLKNNLQMKVFDTNLALVKTQTFYTTSLSDFSNFGNLLMSFDGVSLLKFDFNSSQLCVTKIRQSDSYFMPGPSVMVNKCLLISIVSDYANSFFPLDTAFNKATRTFINFVSIEKQSIVDLDTFSGFKLSSPISIIKAAKDLKLYVFDTKINRLFVFDYLN